MRVLGVDVSTRCTGALLIPAGAVTIRGVDWSLLEPWTVESIPVEQGADESRRVVRLAEVASAFEDVLLHTDPTHVVFEQYAPGATRFAHAKVTAEITGAMKLIAYRYGAHVSAGPIATARKAFLGTTLPRKSADVKQAIRSKLIALGAPPTITSSLDVCDAIVQADFEIGLHGFERLGDGPLESKPRSKKAAKKRTSKEKPVVPPFRVGKYTVEVYKDRVVSLPDGFWHPAVGWWLQPEPTISSKLICNGFVEAVNVAIVMDKNQALVRVNRLDDATDRSSIKASIEAVFRLSEDEDCLYIGEDEIMVFAQDLLCAIRTSLGGTGK